MKIILFYCLLVFLSSQALGLQIRKYTSSSFLLNRRLLIPNQIVYKMSHIWFSFIFILLMNLHSNIYSGICFFLPSKNTPCKISIIAYVLRQTEEITWHIPFEWHYKIHVKLLLYSFPRICLSSLKLLLQLRKNAILHNSSL